MADDWPSEMLARLQAAQAAGSAQERGALYETLVEWLFQSIDGITITERNVHNTPQSQEIDLCFWNDQAPGGFWFLPTALLVECKNWMSPLGSAEVAWFDDKVRKRGLDFGILVAAHGVTGTAHERRDAHDIIARALADKRRLVVITSDELAELRRSDELIVLLKRKLTLLHASGTSLR